MRVEGETYVGDDRSRLRIPSESGEVLNVIEIGIGSKPKGVGLRYGFGLGRVSMRDRSTLRIGLEREVGLPINQNR